MFWFSVCRGKRMVIWHRGKSFQSDFKMHVFISQFLFLIALPLREAVFEKNERFITIRQDYYVRDKFRVPASVCGNRNFCAKFSALRTNSQCECTCETFTNQVRKSTFSFYNRTWSCVSDKQLRLQEGGS